MAIKTSETIPPKYLPHPHFLLWQRNSLYPRKVAATELPNVWMDGGLFSCQRILCRISAAAVRLFPMLISPTIIVYHIISFLVRHSVANKFVWNFFIVIPPTTTELDTPFLPLQLLLLTAEWPELILSPALHFILQSFCFNYRPRHMLPTKNSKLTWFIPVGHLLHSPVLTT